MSSFNSSALSAHLTQAAADTAEAVQAGLRDWGEYVLQQAQQVVPIEEGTLSASGQVVAGENEVAVGFGSGGAAAYAVRQHEDMSYQHDAGRSAKYLEKPAVDSADVGLELIQRRISAVL